MALKPYNSIPSNRIGNPRWIYFKPSWISFWRGGYFVYGQETFIGIILVRHAQAYKNQEIDALIKPAMDWAKTFNWFNARVTVTKNKSGVFDSIFFRRKKDAMLFKMKFC